MARPQKDGIDYFPHDCDASHDEKIESICAIYGHHVGYSVVFRLYERIYRAGGKLIVSDAETLQILSRNVAQMDPKNFTKFINSCLKIGIFDEKLFKASKILSSDGIIKRMEPIISKRNKMKDMYEKSKIKDGVSTPISEAETLQKPHKGKNSREKERKEDNNIISDQLNLENILATMEGDINKFKALGNDEVWIKKTYLHLGVPEAHIDKVLSKKY
jgi:hypothetical protein